MFNCTKLNKLRASVPVLDNNITLSDTCCQRMATACVEPPRRAFPPAGLNSLLYRAIM